MTQELKNFLNSKPVVDFFNVDEAELRDFRNHAPDDMMSILIKKGQTLLLDFSFKTMLFLHLSEDGQSLDSYMVLDTTDYAPLRKVINGEPNITDYRLQLRAFFRVESKPMVIGAVDHGVHNMPLSINISQHGKDEVDNAIVVFTFVLTRTCGLASMMDYMPSMLSSLTDVSNVGPEPADFSNYVLPYALFVPSFQVNADADAMLTIMMLGQLGSMRNQLLLFCKFWTSVDMMLNAIELEEDHLDPEIRDKHNQDRRRIQDFLTTFELVYSDQITTIIEQSPQPIPTVSFNHICHHSAIVANHLMIMENIIFN